MRNNEIIKLELAWDKAMERLDKIDRNEYPLLHLEVTKEEEKARRNMTKAIRAMKGNN